MFSVWMCCLTTVDANHGSWIHCVSCTSLCNPPHLACLHFVVLYIVTCPYSVLAKSTLVTLMHKSHYNHNPFSVSDFFPTVCHFDWQYNTIQNKTSVILLQRLSLWALKKMKRQSFFLLSSDIQNMYIYYI